MNTTDNGKMVNISLEEAKSLYHKGFQDIAFRAYPELGYQSITNYYQVCCVVAPTQTDGRNPLLRIMIINKAMHLNSEKHHHYFFLNKWGNVVRVKNPSTIQEKTFCFDSVEIAKHVWKYFKEDVINAADYVANF